MLGREKDIAEAESNHDAVLRKVGVRCSSERKHFWVIEQAVEPRVDRTNNC